MGGASFIKKIKSCAIPVGSVVSWLLGIQDSSQKAANLKLQLATITATRSD